MWVNEVCTNMQMPIQFRSFIKNVLASLFDFEVLNHTSYGYFKPSNLKIELSYTRQ